MRSRKIHLGCATILLGMLSLSVFAQNTTELFIPLQNRKEVKISPEIDTLLSGKEYFFTMSFDPKYKFSELYFDKGVAVRTDSLLSITPKSKSKGEIDTATLKIIGFANNSRILLYQYIFIKPEPRSYPVFNVNKGVIVLNNTVLERNERYARNNFSEKAVLSYQEPGKTELDISILSVTLSLVNREMQKNLYHKGEKMDEEMMKEIKKLHTNTLAYIKLEVKIGKKIKNVWTRFVMTTQ